MTLRCLRLAALAVLGLTQACSTSPPTTLPSAAPDAVLTPPAALRLQDIPPVPMSLVRQVERYTDFRGHQFVAWHPSRREMLVSHRRAGADTAQLFRVSAPLATPEPLTDFSDPVSQASYEPQNGRYIVFARASGGDEVTQLYRLDLDSRAVTLLTDPTERHASHGWLQRTPQLLVTSVPLDRTAQQGSRARIDTRLWRVDPRQPASRHLLADLPGVGWVSARPAPDDRQIALTRHVSATESQVWLLDVASGRLQRWRPLADDAPPAVWSALAFSADGQGLFLVNDSAGEFRELWWQPLSGAAPTRLSAHLAGDVVGADLNADGSLLAVRVNAQARHALHLFDTRRLVERTLPALPVGSVQSAAFDDQRGELAFGLVSAQSPGTVWSLAPDSGRLQAWTRAESPAGVDSSRFSDAEMIQWPSFDGRSISGLMHRPPARFSGPRPVLVLVHGGPEAQASVGFMQRYNYLLQELGMVIVQPNVRGSSGFGKTFLALDDGFKREDAVRDLGALLDWIATQPALDAQRVLVMGGSYGGYMALAASVHLGDRIAGAIDIVGISHFLTFLERTESYRRDLRRVEYGDERDPAMREFLDRISPLTHAQRIRKPLFVVQGRNDPRVPYTEAEQIVAKVRANGTPVWYLRAENEGHGFARKENQDYQFYASLLFMQRTVLQ